MHLTVHRLLDLAAGSPFVYQSKDFPEGLQRALPFNAGESSSIFTPTQIQDPVEEGVQDPDG